MTPYQQLLHLAFATPAEAEQYLSPLALGAYDRLRAATQREAPFQFERVRLGLGLGLMKLVADLGDHEPARQVQALLHRALRESQSPADIDRIVGREAQLFDDLYENLYVNEDGEDLLNLFGRTLEAGDVETLEEIAVEAVEVARNLDYSQDEDE